MYERRTVNYVCTVYSTVNNVYSILSWELVDLYEYVDLNLT